MAARGDLDAVLADAAKALELEPKLAEAFSLRGAVKEEKGDLDGALGDCRTRSSSIPG